MSHRLARSLARMAALWRLARGRQRALLLTLRGAKVGRKTTIGWRCRFDRPWCVELGERVTIEDQVIFKIVTNDARVVVGDHGFIGNGSQLDVSDRVAIGAHTVIAPRCFLVDHEHGVAAERRIDQQACVGAPVEIGADVWIGVGVAVLAGASIGDGAVVGAHAVVKGHLTPGCIAVGVPARPIAQRGRRELV